MSEKKEKIIHVNNLILHAKNVEIVDAENVEINRAKNIETNDNRKEDHFPRRDPWDFFWRGRPRKEGNEQEGEKENLEIDNK